MSWLDTLEQMQSRDYSKATPAQREEASRDIINMCSYACAAAAVVPLPFSDAVLMLPVQTGMVVAIGRVHGRKLSREDAATLITEFAALAGASFLARQGIKALLPVFGAMLTMPAAFAANWAIGRVALEYIRHPGMSKEQLRGVYQRAKAEGEKLYSRAKLEKFRKAEGAAATRTPSSTETASAPAPAKKSPRKKKPARRTARAARPAKKKSSTRR